MEYRLDKYRIIESENNTLWWEAHFPLAMQRSGKCFIIGDILIIGQPRHEENGYLSLEFYDRFGKLPVWDKTSYYCYASNLLDTATSEKLSEDILQQKMLLSEFNRADQKSVIGLKAGKFRLGRYQIIVTDNNEVEWQAHEWVNNIIGGRCIIESDVLFIGTQEYDRGKQKKIFISELNRLPQWDNTFAWCKSMVLQACQPRQQTGGSQAAIHDRTTYKAELNCRPQDSLFKRIIPPSDSARVRKDFNPRGSSSRRSLNSQPSTIIFFKKHASSVKDHLRSGINQMRTLWQRIQPRRFRLKYLIPLVVAGVLLGLVMLLYSVGKKLHWTHLGMEHHDKPYHHYNNDEKD